MKNAATLPALPNDKTLLQFLQPSFNVLSNIGRRQAHGQPLYAVGGIQRTAAEGFLTVCPLCLSLASPPTHTLALACSSAQGCWCRAFDSHIITGHSLPWHRFDTSVARCHRQVA